MKSNNHRSTAKSRVADASSKLVVSSPLRHIALTSYPTHRRGAERLQSAHRRNMCWLSLSYFEVPDALNQALYNHAETARLVDNHDLCGDILKAPKRLASSVNTYSRNLERARWADLDRLKRPWPFPFSRMCIWFRADIQPPTVRTTNNPASQSREPRPAMDFELAEERSKDASVFGMSVS